MSILSNASKQKSMMCFASKTPSVQHKINKYVQQADIKLAGYNAEQNTPFLGIGSFDGFVERHIPRFRYFIFKHLFH